MSININRLTAALRRDGLSISRQDHIWRIRRIDDPDITADVLLPDGFPVERKAIHQLMAFASTAHPSGGAVHRVIATPDFHPGEIVPVGAVLATSPDLVIPQAIGTDINCGMRLHVADLDLTRFAAGRDALVEKLRAVLLLGRRDLPMTPSTMAAMFQHGLLGWLESVDPKGDLARMDLAQIEDEVERVFRLGSEEGDVSAAPPSLLPPDREVLRDSYLATIGGGNHFVELQVVEEILDRRAAWHWGVRPGNIAVMVHSGSRSVGRHIGRQWITHARTAWPTDQTRPVITPLFGEHAHRYVAAMHTAANYASVNRMLLAELVRLAMREVFDADLAVPLVFDAPHNLVFEEDSMLIHRKGATPAHAGQPVLIPGSMGHSSYLMIGLGNPDFLSSASHGAGRARTRGQMHQLARSGGDLGLSCVNCITLKEERKIQEAPAAYKPIQEVIDVQVEAGIVAPVARMRPLLTFKA